MIKKTTTYLWSLRRQFAKYFIVGISSVIIDMGSLVFLKEAFGIAPVIAVLANQAGLLVYIFLMNKYWSFKGSVLSHKQIIRFGAVVAFNYFFSVSAMYIFNHRLNFDYRLVRLGSIAMAVSWNFFLYKYWVYVKEVNPEIIPNQAEISSK